MLSSAMLRFAPRSFFPALETYHIVDRKKEQKDRIYSIKYRQVPTDQAFERCLLILLSEASKAQVQ